MTWPLWRHRVVNQAGDQTILPLTAHITPHTTPLCFPFCTFPHTTTGFLSPSHTHYAFLYFLTFHFLHCCALRLPDSLPLFPATTPFLHTHTACPFCLPCPGSFAHHTHTTTSSSTLSPAFPLLPTRWGSDFIARAFFHTSHGVLGGIPSGWWVAFFVVVVGGLVGLCAAGWCGWAISLHSDGTGMVNSLCAATAPCTSSPHTPSLPTTTSTILHVILPCSAFTAVVGQAFWEAFLPACRGADTLYLSLTLTFLLPSLV